MSCARCLWKEEVAFASLVLLCRGNIAKTNFWQEVPEKMEGNFKITCKLPLLDTVPCSAVRFWRKERDSNPRYSYPYTAFRVRPVRPLRHLSLVSQTNECLLTGYKSNNNLQINHPVEKIASLICRIVRRERTCGCRRAVYRAAVSVADRSIFSYLATLYDSVLQQWENFSINSGRGITCGNFRS